MNDLTLCISTKLLLIGLLSILVILIGVILTLEMSPEVKDFTDASNIKMAWNDLWLGVLD